jgi:HAD superfamily hydrolase (TIGR01509 family)
MDGTLVDSRAYHWRSWQEALAADGTAVTEAQFLATFGRRNDAILPLWLGANATLERIRRVADHKEVAYRRIVDREGLAPLPGVADWVRRLDEAGWRQAVASSAPRLNVEVVLRVVGLERCFGALVAAEDVRHGKPDPEVFLTAAARLGAPPARCIVVEDVEHGIEAARRAGMRTIGVGGVAAGDLVVGSLADLPADSFDRLLEAR